MRFFLLTIDFTLLGFWKIVIFLAWTLIILLKTLGSGLQFAWEAIGNIKFLQRPWKFFNSLFSFFNEIWDSSPLYSIRRAAANDLKAFSRYLVESKICSRISFVLLLFFLLLTYAALFWPPFYLAYWHKYETGTASWYGGEFYGRPTASGEIFKPGNYYTAAHKTLPLHTYVLVKNKQNGKEVLVRINDRGPFKPGRVIDLTEAAAKKLGMHNKGIAPVTLYTYRFF
jgi:rare lipoprotein A